MSYRILVWIAEDSECRIGHTSDELRCTISQIVILAKSVMFDTMTP